MGVLYAKVSGQWVPIAPAGTVIPPAYAGYRGDAVTSARFGSTAIADQSIGFLVNSNGTLDQIVPNGSISSVWQRNAAGTSHEQIAVFRYTYSGLNGLGFGVHPNHGTPFDGIWSEATRNAVHGNDYILLKERASGLLLINGWNQVEIRVTNVARLTANGAGVNITGSMGVNLGQSWGTPTLLVNPGQLKVQGLSSGKSWSVAHVLVDNSVNTSQSTRIALNHPGVAPQLRSTVADGEVLSAVNNPESDYTNFKGLAYITMSTATKKKNIRTLRKGVQREKVHHDPMVDECPEPNIMALRPVVYRPEVPAMRLVRKEGYDGDPESSDAWESAEAIGPHGVMGKRERLGLIAEDVQHVMPQAVQYDIDGNARGIMFDQVTIALLDHVQQLTRTIETLQYRIAELEGTS